MFQSKIIAIYVSLKPFRGTPPRLWAWKLTLCYVQCSLAITLLWIILRWLISCKVFWRSFLTCIHEYCWLWCNLTIVEVLKVVPLILPDSEPDPQAIGPCQPNPLAEAMFPISKAKFCKEWEYSDPMKNEYPEEHPRQVVNCESHWSVITLLGFFLFFWSCGRSLQRYENLK